MTKPAEDAAWLDACCASPLFRELPRGRVKVLLKNRGELQGFSRGQVLDGYLRKLGIVIKGRLSVFSESGTLLNQLQPGNMFGVSTVFTGYSSHITRISAAVNSTVLFLREEELAAVFAEDFSVNRSYLSFLTDRIRFLNGKIDLFSASTAGEKLRLYLLHLRRDSPEVEVEPLARLGNTLGMGRASLYRSIEKLEEEGILSRNGRLWHIDWEKLERSGQTS